MTALEPIFERLGLQQYYHAFIEEGFDTWETVLDIHESDLESLNVKLGHRRKLQRAIADYRGFASDQPLGSPSQDLLSQELPSSESTLTSASQSKTSTSSTTEQKRRYRRHPKPDENAPERPPSAYVLFSNHIREEIRAENLSFTDIARLVGTKWQALPGPEKHEYQEEAEALKETYNSQLVEYKKTDEFRQYQDYIADFKAKHGGTSINEHKRPKLEPSDSPPLPSASLGDRSEAVPLITGHVRSGSIGSQSIASVAGRSGAMSSLPSFDAADRQQDGPQQHFVDDRRHSGRPPGRGSVSREGNTAKLESPDPTPNIIPYTEPQSLATAPLGRTTRYRYDSGGQTQPWSGQSPTPSVYGSPISTLSSFRPMGNSPSSTGTAISQDNWRDHSHEVSLQSYRISGAQSPQQPGSLAISQLVTPTNPSSTGTESLRRVLPPLPEQSSLSTTTSGPFGLFGTPNQPPAPQGRQFSSRAMVYRQGRGREVTDIAEIPENEDTSTLLGISERSQDPSSTTKPKHQPGNRR